VTTGTYTSGPGASASAGSRVAGSGVCGCVCVCVWMYAYFCMHVIVTICILPQKHSASRKTNPPTSRAISMSGIQSPGTANKQISKSLMGMQVMKT